VSGIAITRMRIALLSRYGFPELWLRWPAAVAGTLAAAFRPSYALTSFEFWTRPYYEHIARNFHTVGRFGYVWDEALGVPFGPRLYNNWATYVLYGALSPRAFRLLSLGTYLAAVLAGGWLTGHWIVATVVAVLLLGAPAAIYSLVACMLKPEVIWWPLVLIAVTAALTGEWPITAALGGLLLLVNLPVAAIAGIILAPLWLYASLRTGAPAGGWALVAVVPGVAKTAIRAWQAWRDPIAGKIATDQRKMTESAAGPPRVLLGLAVSFVLPMLLAGWPMPLETLLLAAAAVAVALINGRLIKIADTVTLLLMFLTLVVAVTLASGVWTGLLGVALVAFYQPFAHYGAVAGRAEAEALSRAQAAPPAQRLAGLREVASHYPWFAPTDREGPMDMMHLLAAIPDGARVFIESTDDSRTGSAYRSFRNWADAIVSSRQVELANQFFLLRLVEPSLADRYLDRFSARFLSADRMRSLCETLGASRVIAFDPATVAALEGTGFVKVATASASACAAFVDSLHMPAHDLVLLRVPQPTDIIEPPVAWTRRGNTLRWPAGAGTSYVVRYRHHRRFSARQGNAVASVHPVAVDDLPDLRFIRVDAVADGEMTLEFH
jgi:hypothetical protein